MRSVPSHICKPPSEASLAHKLLHSYPHSLVNGPSDVPSTLSSPLPPIPALSSPLSAEAWGGLLEDPILEPGGLSGDQSRLTWGREAIGDWLSRVCIVGAVVPRPS